MHCSEAEFTVPALSFGIFFTHPLDQPLVKPQFLLVPNLMAWCCLIPLAKLVRLLTTIKCRWSPAHLAANLHLCSLVSWIWYSPLTGYHSTPLLPQWVWFSTLMGKWCLAFFPLVTMKLRLFSCFLEVVQYHVASPKTWGRIRKGGFMHLLHTLLSSRHECDQHYI